MTEKFYIFPGMVGILTDLVVLTLVLESFYLVSKVRKLSERVSVLEALIEHISKR